MLDGERYENEYSTVILSAFSVITLRAPNATMYYQHDYGSPNMAEISKAFSMKPTFEDSVRRATMPRFPLTIAY